MGVPWAVRLLVLLAALRQAVQEPSLELGALPDEPVFSHSGRQVLQEDHVRRATAKYLSNQELESHLQDFAQRCGHLSRLFSVGKSVKGSPLYVLEISNSPGKSEAKPNVKYVGNMHGNEPTGRVFMVALAEWLCANYSSDERAARLVDGVHLFLMPTMNPDGFARKMRKNVGGVDLNRDFPDRLRSPSMKPTGQEQPETKAMIEWLRQTRFAASLNMHEGALVANYPWDGTADGQRRYDTCPDDATFIHLSKSYAKAHRKMSLPTNEEFPDGGITNGAAWYPIWGSMQDFNYIVADCFELTLELSESKWPAEDTLYELWEDNKEALLRFPMVAALGGVHGTVASQASRLRLARGRELRPLQATITVVGVNKTVTSGAQFGDYYRPLAPGDYVIQVAADGYAPFSKPVTVPADDSGVVLNVVLLEEGGQDNSSLAAALPDMGGLVVRPWVAYDQLLMLLLAVALLQALRLAHVRLRKHTSGLVTWRRSQ